MYLGYNKNVEEKVKDKTPIRETYKFIVLWVFLVIFVRILSVLLGFLIQRNLDYVDYFY